MGVLFNLWRGIPIKRGEADTQALRRGLAVLEAGQILAVAPEGTRSNNGCLQHGHPGIVVIALHSRAPILPMVYYGSEKFRRNLTQLRRTDFKITIGQSFYLDSCGNKVTRHIRKLMVDEIMYQLAALLPAKYRGDYANLAAATENFLRFPYPSKSNLTLAKDKYLQIMTPVPM
jgi:1-acyl-sn-glycerol-3-phosphate acyltransferase